MSKGMNAKKNAKKKPAKSADEKRAEKKAKKTEVNIFGPVSYTHLTLPTKA